MDLKALFLLSRPPWGQLTKTLRIMRLTAFFLLIGLLHVGATGFTQTVTLSVKNVPVQKIFKEIFRQTGISILYNEQLFEHAGPVSIEAKDLSVQEVLNQCFRDLPFTYEFADNGIVIKAKESQTPILQAGDTSLASLPPSDIHGHITDSTGAPLSGASVSVKGTKKGTTTDAKGDFDLKNVDDHATLIISFTGFDSREFKLFNNPEVRSGGLSVMLKHGTSALDAIQVIAYGTTTKRLNTGNTTTVTSSEIEKQPVSNPLAALEGRAAGLFVTQQTGVPGGNFNIQIRGQNSIFNGNNPLYVIDGVPFAGAAINSNLIGTSVIGGGSAFSNVDPSNIESIDILKDADATAIYGSRGANGVILITTKKGKIGKSLFDFNISSGIGSVTRMLPLLNTTDYLAMRHEAFSNDGATPDPSFDYDLTVWDTTRYTNWQKELIGGNAHVTNVQANFSGGDVNSQYIIGGSYYGTSTVFPGDFSDKKVSAHVGLNHNSTDRRFKLSFSGNYVIDNNNLPTFDPTRNAVSLAPDAPVGLTPTGHINWQNGTFGSNPYQYLLQPYNSSANNLISNLTISYTVLKGLDIRANLGYNHMQIGETSETPVSALNPAYGITTGSTLFSNQSLSSWITEPQIEYKNSSQVGNFDFLAGLTFQQNGNTGENINGTGFTNDALIGNISAASQITALNSTDIKYRYQSGFARLNYNFQDRYIVNLTARRDGSSRFGPGNQFANFGAIGAAWIFTREKWWKSLSSLISFGKLRASYGITGNDQIGDYRYLDTWSPTPYAYQGQTGLQPSWLANPDFGWEKNKKSEIGLELGLWKERILFTGSYYINKSSDQLILYTLPGITGFPYIVQNSNATVKNSGLEFNLNITNIKTKDFSWQANFNFTIPKNDLLGYPDFATSPYVNTYAIGKSLSIIKAYHYTGVNPKTGIYNFAAKDSANPVYPDDLQALKQTAPRYYGGFQNNFNYKNWQLGIFFQFVNQQGFNYLYYNAKQPGMFGNQPALVQDHWRTPGDHATNEKFSQNYGESFTAYLNMTFSSDQVISDASYIRMKTVDLSYSFSGNRMKKMKLENCRLFIQGQNLLTITHYLGMDPENQSMFVIPPLKVIMVGFQCTF